MGDMVLLVFDGDALVLLQLVEAVATLALGARRRRGLVVKFAAGETETVLALRGERGQVCREMLVSVERDDARGSCRFCGVPAVRSYGWRSSTGTWVS